jgi:maleylpyruvate isomerase
VDLGAGYRPADWPQEFVDSQLSSVTQSMTRRGTCPAVTIRASHTTYRIGDGALATVTGDAAGLLAWLTGRADGHDLQRVPAGPLPPIPPFS